MKTYFSLFLLFIYTVVYGLNNSTNKWTIDSLNRKQVDSIFSKARNLCLKDKNYTKALELFSATDSLYSKLKLFPKVIDSKVNQSRCLFYLNKPKEEELKPLNQALKITYKIRNSVDWYEVGHLYEYCSQFYYSIREYENAKFYGLKASNIFSNHYHDNRINIDEHRISSRLHLGLVEQRLFNYDSAERYVYEAIRLADEMKDEPMLAKSYRILLLIYAQSNQTEKQGQLLEEHKERFNNYDLKLYELYDLITSKSDYYRETKQFLLALKALSDFEERLVGSPYKDHFSSWYIRIRRAYILYDMKDYQGIIELLDNKGLDEKLMNQQKYFRTSELRLLAESYHLINQNDKAEEVLQNALKYYFKNIEQLSDFHHKIDIRKAKNRDLSLFQTLLLKAEIAKKIYHSTNDDAYLMTSNDLYNALHELVKGIGWNSSEDKFIDNDEFRQLYENLLETFYTRWKENQDTDLFFDAFSVCDESKNVTILNELKSIKQEEFQNSIPLDVLNKERRLIRTYDSIQNIFYTRESEKSVRLKDSIDKEFNTFKEEIKAISPNYYAVKYRSDKSFKRLLDEKFRGDNVIEYFYGNKAIYVFNVNGEKQVFDKIPISDNLNHNINETMKSLHSRDIEIFKASSSVVYKRLLEKYIDLSKRNKVVLDGKLHLLPLESLWVSSKDKPHFLIEDINMIRLNSVMQKFSSQSGQEAALLFAPFALKEGFDMTKLSSSAYEVKRISQILDGVVYLDKDASKAKFIEHASNKSIIHLATHSSINKMTPLNSKIYFYDNSDFEPSQKYLKLEELYGIRLNSDLVTLSACETGIGKEVKGKGVISLSNAFAFSGVKSTVMSLWKIPDQETSSIMVSFYENLDKGQYKDEALRNAKLNYLKSTSDEALKHPYYWGGFVISGDASPIYTSSKSIYFIVAVIVLIALFFLIKRYINQ